MNEEIRLHKFLRMVPGMGNVPPNWNFELQKALADSLVRVGFGGKLELTDAGRQELSK